MLATGLAGCSSDNSSERAAIGDTRPTTSQTLDARRQTTGGGEPGASGDTSPSTSQTLDARRQTAEESSTTIVPVRVIEVIERAGWGAAPEGAEMEEHVVERLTVHHTGVALEDNREAPARLRAHQVFHQTDRGWPDLAYHFAIDRNGNIYEGRSPKFRGDTATSYDPTGHLLVVLEGNFDVEPTAEAQLGSLTDLLAWASGRYSVAVDSIKSHRDYAPGETSCPGDNLYPLVESGELARAVGSLVTKESTELIYLRGQEAIARVASIEAP
jgi:N-acetylmuramoyl-L-alanine amidase